MSEEVPQAAEGGEASEERQADRCAEEQRQEADGIKTKNEGGSKTATCRARAKAACNATNCKAQERHQLEVQKAAATATREEKAAAINARGATTRANGREDGGSRRGAVRKQTGRARAAGRRQTGRSMKCARRSKMHTPKAPGRWRQFPEMVDSARSEKRDGPKTLMRQMDQWIGCLAYANNLQAERVRMLENGSSERDTDHGLSSSDGDMRG